MEVDHTEHDTSRCFVPEILVDFLAKQIRLGSKSIEPASYFLHGVCLLVDISGFTKLSGDFCAQGKSGIDGLQLATNGYMGKLVETIYLFGGDIIKFAGDAIICIFPSTLITKVVRSKKGKTLRRSTDAGSLDFCDDDSGIADSKKRGLLCSSVSFRPELRTDSSERDIGANLRKVTNIRPDHVLRAMHCANKLRILRTDSLTVHVAISCGEMCFGVLGGYENRWECLISGPCLQELSGCLDDAPSMQAVMTAGCYEIINSFRAPPLEHVLTPKKDMAGIDEDSSKAFLDDEVKDDSIKHASDKPVVAGYTFTLESMPSGNHKLLDVSKAEDSSKYEVLQTPAPKTKNDDTLHALIQQFVPVLINEANKHGTGLNYLSEIREVTTMFMKWDSYDVSEKYADLLVLQECFFAAQKILHTTGAYLRQFLVDDKGCVLIACWGMPSQTYLDNAHRALTSAVEIRAALLQLQMTCSFGITTGDVYCGTVGSALRMEYAAIGSVVNMAARLMGKAHGSILIDEVTFQRIPSVLQSSLLRWSPIQVKGRAEPLQVFEHKGDTAVQETSISATEQILNGQEDLLEVRDCCRKPFADLLRTLDGRIPLRRRSTVRDLFTSLAVNPATRNSSNTSARMKVLLLEGKKGAGCKSSNAWLCKQAQNASIRAVHVTLMEKSFHYPYFLLYKVFTQIAPKDVYSSKVAQRRYVHALLKEVYPDDTNMAVQIAFPIMKQALAMTCTYSRDQNHHQVETSVSLGGGVSSRSNREFSARSIRVVKDKDSKFPPKLVTEVLTTIFRHLLTERTVLVIIDDIHNSDEESLRVLVELLKIDSRSAIVMTAHSGLESEKQPSAASKREHHKKASSPRNVVLDAKVSMWQVRYRGLLEQEQNVCLINVGAFTIPEISLMLRTIPGSSEFPINLASLVANLSGGEFFWIKEIMHFLHENGSKQFLTTIGSHGSENEGERGIPLMKSPSMNSMGSTSIPQSLSRVGSNSKFNAMEHLKLEQLVVCRFENMNLATKQVLRTASIIGAVFSRQVLYGVLPKTLKADVTNCLNTLVQQQWIFRSESEPSERRNLHKVIADYIEEISAGDASEAAQLTYHYGKCDIDKALYYTYQATMFLMENGSFFELSECAELLFQAVDYCTTSHSIDVLTKLVKEVVKSTADIQQPRRSGLQMLARFFWCGARRSASVHTEDGGATAGNPTASSGASMGRAGCSGSLGSADNRNPGKTVFTEHHQHGGDATFIAAYHGDQSEAQHHFLQQLQYLLGVLTKRKTELTSDKHSHRAKDWERAVLSNSERIRNKQHAKASGSGRFSNVSSNR